MDPKRAAELLSVERTRLEQTLAELRPDSGEELSHTDQHTADDGSELFEQERDAGLTDRLREELAAVKRAEERLILGTYGLSVESGEPIPDDRLEAVPWAERRSRSRRATTTAADRKRRIFRAACDSFAPGGLLGSRPSTPLSPRGL